jgi:endonuclease YncB( thermonuclease family)
MDYKYQYKSIVTKVIDGDTFEATIDLGFSIYIHKKVRLWAIDAPEVSKPETREAGLKTTERLKELIEGKQVMLVTVKEYDKYGRYCAKCLLTDDGFSRDVGQILLNESLAKEYYGGKKIHI